jgi:hypothetical protein
MGLVAPMALSVAAVIVVASGVRPAEAIETCRTIPATIVGTERDDVLTGTEHVDVIVGLGGNDTIITAEGSDVVCDGASSSRRGRRRCRVAAGRHPRRRRGSRPRHYRKRFRF